MKDRRDERTAQVQDADNRTENNLDERIEKFQDQLKNVCYYRVPLKYVCDIGLVYQPVRFNTK